MINLDLLKKLYQVILNKDIFWYSGLNNIFNYQLN